MIHTDGNMRYSALGLLFALMAALTTGRLSAGEVNVRQKEPGRGAYRDLFQVDNGLNRYVIVANDTVLEHDDKGSAIGLFEPYFQANFYATGFIRFTIDGVSSRDVPMSAKTWKKGNCAGVEATFKPINGCTPHIVLFMSPLHEVLWGRLYLEGGPTPKSVEVDIWARPNNTTARDKYLRHVVTPTAEYPPVSEPFTTHRLDPSVDWFFYADQEYDVGKITEGDNKKSWGPCLFMCDPAAVQRTELIYGNHITVSTRFEMKPGEREFRFGLWEHMKPMPNDEVLSRWKKQIEAYRTFIKNEGFGEL